VVVKLPGFYLVRKYDTLKRLSNALECDIENIL